MNPKESKKINLYGLLIWLVLFWLLIPFKLVKQYPVILIGYAYTIFILIANYMLIGNDDVAGKNEVDFNNDPTRLATLVNNKALQVSTAIFALAVATKSIFKTDFYRQLLLLILYTLIFGVGFILPIYFISNFKDSNRVVEMNELLMRIRNVSLSYSIGFMVCGLALTLYRVYELKF